MGWGRGMKTQAPRRGKVASFPPGRSTTKTRRRPKKAGRRRFRLTWNRLELLLGLAVVAALFVYRGLDADTSSWISADAVSGWMGGETVTGPVTHVRDGDTIEVAGLPIRLQVLNCAELGTRLGSEGRTAMSRLVSGRQLTCELSGEWTHDRQAGRYFLPNGEDVAALLIEQGVCGRCARYDPFRRYAEAQAKAAPYQGEVPGYCMGLW